MTARGWGYWTEQKLEMLAAYLPAFTTAAVNKARGTTIYLDLFAGVPENFSKTTGKPISGSPRIALDATPPFTKVRLFELPSKAAKLEADLLAAHPGRDVKVWGGDCNTKIDEALAELRPISWAPTFAFIDQQAAEIHWSTLEKLAAFRQRSAYKAELWMLFAPSMLPRGMKALTQESVDLFRGRIDAMFGPGDWHPIYQGRLSGELDGGQFRDELTNLMRWQLETVLGYKRTHIFDMKNTNGGPLYTMIFATDHEAGDRIMSHIYGGAAEKRPRMQAEARAEVLAKRERDGKVAPGLFDPIPRALPPDKLYEHQPPTEPFGKR